MMPFIIELDLLKVKKVVLYMFFYVKIKIDIYDLYDLCDDKNVFDSIIMLRFGTTKIVKEERYGVKHPKTVWDVDVKNIVISKLVETKNSYKYLLDIYVKL